MHEAVCARAKALRRCVQMSPAFNQKLDGLVVPRHGGGMEREPDTGVADEGIRVCMQIRIIWIGIIAAVVLWTPA